VSGDPKESEFGISGFSKARYTGSFKSRSAISREDLNHPSVKTCVRRSQRVEVQSIGDSGDRKILQLEITIRDISTGELCGP
jgi:hypothetical protein